jgi:hypothetical protein
LLGVRRHHSWPPRTACLAPLYPHAAPRLLPPIAALLLLTPLVTCMCRPTSLSLLVMLGDTAVARVSEGRIRAWPQHRCRSIGGCTRTPRCSTACSRTSWRPLLCSRCDPSADSFLPLSPLSAMAVGRLQASQSREVTIIQSSASLASPSSGPTDRPHPTLSLAPPCSNWSFFAPSCH